MTYYVITDFDEKLYYSKILNKVTQKHPSIYMTRIEAQAELNFIDNELRNMYGLKVMPAELIIKNKGKKYGTK